jgi:hypothetical protein
VRCDIIADQDLADLLQPVQVQDGSKAVPVGTTIAITGEEGDDLSGADALAAEGDAAAATPKSEEKPKDTSDSKSSGVTPSLATPADQTKYGAGGGTEEMKSPIKEHGEDRPTFFASPLARKLALERGVPLKDVKGTGPEGRIVKVSDEGWVLRGERRGYERVGDREQQGCVSGTTRPERSHLKSEFLLEMGFGQVGQVQSLPFLIPQCEEERKGGNDRARKTMTR